MTIRIRKRIIWTLLVAFLFSFSSFVYWPKEHATAATVSTPTSINGYPNKCKYNTSVDGPIPEGVAPCSLPSEDNKNGFKFNSKFYFDPVIIDNDPYTVLPARKLIVYGTPFTVPSKIQSFKKGMQPDGGVIIPGQGHFYVYSNEHGGYVFGEYRYLGFTYDNNLYSNINFIVDMDLGVPIQNKHWIYLPWKELPNDYARKPSTPGAVYDGREDVTSRDFDQIREYIQNKLNFTMTQSVRYSDRYKVLTGFQYRDPRQYMSLHQSPTTKERGIGTMYHYSWDSNSIWYQTFFMPKLDETTKDRERVEASCAVVPVSNKPIPIGKSKKVKVEVKLTGTLLDEDYYGEPLDEFLYYTRKDIDYWRLDMSNPAGGGYTQLASNKAKDGVVVKSNTASAVYTIEIDTQKLDRSSDDVWKFKSNAGVFAFYYDHTYSNPSYSSQYCNLEVNFEPTEKQPMLSSFGVVPEIQFERLSQFTSAMVGYEDFSYGEDVDYYEFEITNISDGSKATRKFDPAIPEVKAPKAGYLDQAAVQNFLHNFMKSKFSQEMVSDSIARQFEIKQTIVDKDATVNNKSMALQSVTVIHTPVAGCGVDHDTLPAPPQYISPKADWPFDWYDVVPFPVTDSAPDLIPHKGCEDPVGYDEFTKRVFIDGAEIDAEEFYNGDYIFGEDKLGIREVKTTFTAPDGTESFKIQHVVIHESKPRVSLKLEGLYKQNRTMTAIDRSAASNDQWVEQNSPLEITSFSFVKPSDPNLKCRTGYCESNKSEKMYMYKEPGHYKMSIAAKRVITYDGGKTITRYSDPYVVDYEIMPDHKPAVAVHAYNTEISRLDQLELLYDVVSTDGDFIAEQNMKVYHDSDNDGDFDDLVFETDEPITQLPQLSKLGQYQIVAYAKEGTTQNRLMEFVSPADDKTHTVESYFFIDNYAPSSDLYLDVPNEKADMDVYFMLDANLKQESTDYVRGNKVTLTNAFNSANMLANIGIWDMKTYTYSQSASTSRSTGTSYPPSTTTYSSEGYSGTLTRTSVSNSPYSVDEGKYVSKTDSKTATGSCSSSVTTYYDEKGNYDSSSSWNNCGGSQSYSDGQYSGTLSRTGESPNGPSCGSTGPKNGSCSRGWTAYYSGTVYWTRDVWEPKMVSYDSYTGFYSGTIYKDVRQPFDTSFMRAVPTKYVIYISDGGATQLSDLQNVMNKHNAHLILVGSDILESQISHEKFIAHDDSIENVVDDVIQYIAESNPANPKVLKLIGETIETATATFDAEKDSIPEENDQLQITQEPNYYDNSMGFDTFGGKQLISDKSSANWQPYQSAITLNKPGKYQFIRRTKDLPSTDPNFADYSYYSNESVIDVYVHRKPIPDVALDFDYILSENRYRTSWIDLSYDLDHSITRAATDRGIQARAIKLTNEGTGEVYTRIPESVEPGSYILDYTVQDIEGVWSDPIRRTYILPTTVPVQMKSNLKTTYPGFSLASVPASESLTAYDLWTRYPYAIHLQFNMGSILSRNVPYYTGTKTGNDIRWADETFTIPNTTPDGPYTFSIRGNGTVAGSTAVQTYSVNVETPIQLTGRVDSLDSAIQDVDTVVVGDSYKLYAHTTKYPDQLANPSATTVVIFKGTAYQRTIVLASELESSTGYGAKSWNGAITIGNMPNGRYTFEWRSRTPNGNMETVAKQIEVVNNRPPTADLLWSPNPVYEGDTVQLASSIRDLDDDTLMVNYETISPSGSRRTFQYTLDPDYEHTEPQLRMVETGNWLVRLTVSDGKAPSVVVEKTIPVRTLHVGGEVLHTELWNSHRQAYNRKKSGNPDSPRGYDVFWAGEKFVLRADTTMTGTPTRAQRVEVAFGIYEAVLSAEDAAQTIWNGELWDEAFEGLEDGPARFVFTAYYSNGTVKTTEVEIQLQGSASEIIGVHRVK
ncbi:Athe_2463 domain-containing protein [Paenibacillus soyae]|uniref:Uncharacterized protein n=1 Tax=Paenibacillus soyae TaxID=2969249 RepID=A0A9X2SA28_9BACL|nr:hypothetical protein [Paenibacillus soyae]MCR2806104.1 hypothetical protein [Paenibacillus soyae]